MFGFYPSPFIVIVMLAATEVLLPRLLLVVVSNTPVLSRVHAVRALRSSIRPIRYRYAAAIIVIMALAIGIIVSTLALPGPTLAQGTLSKLNTPVAFYGYETNFMTFSTQGVTYAAKYKWEREGQSDTLELDTPSYGYTSADAGERRVRVRGVDSADNEGPWSGYASFTVASTDPKLSQPTLIFNAVARSITVSGYTYTGATKYIINITSPDATETPQESTSAEHVISQVQVGTYLVKVQAETDTYRTAFSDTASVEVTPATVPDAPENLRGTAGVGQAILTWAAPSSNGGSAVTKYQSSPDGTNWANVTGGANASTTTISSLTNGTFSTLSIHAVNVVGEGPHASVKVRAGASTTPRWSGTMKVGAQGPLLGWNSTEDVFAGDSLDDTSFMEDGRTFVFSAITLQTNGDLAIAFDDTTKSDRTEIDDLHFNVRSDSFRIRDASERESDGDLILTWTGTRLTWTVGDTLELTITPGIPPAIISGPDAPQSLTATPSDGEVALTWDAPASDGGAPVTTYQYRQSTDGGTSWDPAWTDISGTASHTITGLINGTEYTFAIRAVNGVSVGNSASVSSTLGLDYDDDDNGLIEVADLAQLNAIRWDLDGDGSSTESGYTTAFPMPYAGMGCPATGCIGYELTADLDFDTNDSASADSGDEYWDGGAGWEPLGTGTSTSSFSAIFSGRGHTISNLYIRGPTTLYVGLFGYTGSSARVQNVGIVDTSVTGGSDVGGLVGNNDGIVTQSYSTGTISGAAQSTRVGGLVGFNQGHGRIATSYSTSSVTGGSEIGGLVGQNKGDVIAGYATGTVPGVADGTGAGVAGLVGFHPLGSITASYSTGAVTGPSAAGGLVGAKDVGATVTDSYWDTQTSGQSTSSGGVGKSTSELQGPLDDTGIYTNWNVDLDNADDDDSTSTGGDNPWDFGTDRQYPVLRADLNADGKASWEEFGDQGRFPDAPSITSVTTEAADQLTVVWTAPSWDGGSAITGYDLRYISTYSTDKSDAN